MASKLGTVLEIEAAESYIKRPAGPMVTVEVQDITRLAGFIRISSMAEGAPTTNSVRQRILYSGLPNQCKKCRNFGHHARACTVFSARQRESHSQHFPPREDTGGKTVDINGTGQNTTATRKARPQALAPPGMREKKGEGAREEDKGTRPPPPLHQAHPQPARRDPSRPECSELGSNQRKPSGNELRDPEMPDPPKSSDSQKEMAQPSAEQGKVNATTPNSKLQFGIQDTVASETSAKDA
ncbi:unnamed protein product [Sphagnum jensenii]|uniref:CCHC-type domain-containing protein n=1 Tax=Sphagnum jensenii TaxID=128206 RepID=A0ABP1AA94_9BRYO